MEQTNEKLWQDEKEIIKESKKEINGAAAAQTEKKMPVYKKILLAVSALLVLIIAVQAINAAKYRMSVNVKDGKNMIGVNPSGNDLDFGDLSRENGMTRYVTIKSEGNVPTYIAIWKFGEISDLVRIEKNYFVLKPGEETKLSFDVSIPVSAAAKQYSGWVWIFRLPKII